MVSLSGDGFANNFRKAACTAFERRKAAAGAILPVRPARLGRPSSSSRGPGPRAGPPLGPAQGPRVELVWVAEILYDKNLYYFIEEV